MRNSARRHQGPPSGGKKDLTSLICELLASKEIVASEVVTEVVRSGVAAADKVAWEIWRLYMEGVIEVSLAEGSEWDLDLLERMALNSKPFFPAALNSASLFIKMADPSKLS